MNSPRKETVSGNTMTLVRQMSEERTSWSDDEINTQREVFSRTVSMREKVSQSAHQEPERSSAHDRDRLRNIKVTMVNWSAECDTIKRDIIDPESIFVARRRGEGSRPIFDREEINRGRELDRDGWEERFMFSSSEDSDSTYFEPVHPSRSSGSRSRRFFMRDAKYSLPRVGASCMPRRRKERSLDGFIASSSRGRSESCDRNRLHWSSSQHAQREIDQIYYDENYSSRETLLASSRYFEGRGGGNERPERLLVVTGRSPYLSCQSIASYPLTTLYLTETDRNYEVLVSEPLPPFRLIYQPGFEY